MSMRFDVRNPVAHLACTDDAGCNFAEKKNVLVVAISVDSLINMRVIT